MFMVEEGELGLGEEGDWCLFGSWGHCVDGGGGGVGWCYMYTERRSSIVSLLNQLSILFLFLCLCLWYVGGIRMLSIDAVTLCLVIYILFVQVELSPELTGLVD